MGVDAVGKISSNAFVFTNNSEKINSSNPGDIIDLVSSSDSDTGFKYLLIHFCFCF